MKVYKIRGVPKDVCCVEQKLAYNLASFYKTCITNDLKQAFDASQRLDIIYGYRDYMMRYFAEHYPKTRYNPDALKVALNQGLKNYIEHPFIADTYERVAEGFPIPYPVE